MRPSGPQGPWKLLAKITNKDTIQEEQNMFRSKMAKGFIMGLGLAVALSTAAFAEKVPEEEMRIQITSIGEEAEALPPDAPLSDDGQVIPKEPRNDAAVSGLAGAGSDGSPVSIEPSAAASNVNKQMYDKQLEADRYLFADHTDELAAKGITVTHTSVTNGYIEIGIIPFNDENAGFIYKALGKDKIKVVEGVQAVAQDIGQAADGSEIYEAELYDLAEDAAVIADEDQRVYMTANTVSAPAESVDQTTVLAMIAAAVVLLGGTLLVTRRMKTVKS
jgi:uncharacterized protein YdaT